LPDGFSKLSNLQIFAAQGFLYDRASAIHIDASENVQGVRLMKNLTQFRGDLVISNVQMISKDDAEEAELKNKKNLNKLTLKWSDPGDCHVMQHNPEDVLQVLQPPTSLRSLLLKCYPGVSLPCLLQPHMINLNDSIGIFPSLTDLTISECQNLSSLEGLLHPDHVPAIRKVSIDNCKSLSSVATERFRDLSFVEELEVRGCRNICSQSLVSPSLKELKLGDSGSLLDNIDCSSLKHLRVEHCLNIIWPIGLVLPSSLKTLVFEHCGDISPSVPGCHRIISIPGTIWRDNLALLEELVIRYCPNIVSIGGAEAVSHISSVRIYNCPSLKEAEEIMSFRRDDGTRKGF